MWEHYEINTLILKATYIMSLLKTLSSYPYLMHDEKFQGNKFIASSTNPSWFSPHISTFQYHIKIQHQNFQDFQTCNKKKKTFHTTTDMPLINFSIMC